jgi:hypothetical protein
MFSGGVGSWAAAKRVAEAHGTEGMVLLFADTLVEDADTYRFLVEAATNVVGLGSDSERLKNLLDVIALDLTRADTPRLRKGVLRWVREEACETIPGLVWLADGRTPWEVFSDTKSFPRQFVDPCSRILKRELCDRWIAEHYTPETVTVHVGIDWSEIHRYERMRDFKVPWKYKAPLCEAPYLTKGDMHDWAAREGLAKQRLYQLGMPHANCGGGCVKMGQGGFARLLTADPRMYAEWEESEAKLRDELGVDLAILRDRTGGTSTPLTLTALRERIEGGGQVDMFDIGGCGCLAGDERGRR